MTAEFNKSIIVVEGEQYIIKGLDIWAYRWTDTKKRITVLVQDQTRNLPVYEIKKDDLVVRFAAIEQSNNVWCIYY